MNKKRVLVIGAAGYIGQYLLSVMDNEYIIFGDLKHTGYADLDITETGKVLSLIKERNITTVVILAGIVGEPACLVDPKRADEVNHRAVARLAEGTDAHIIYMSTAEMYDLSTGQNLHENSPVKPYNIYTETKYAAERHLISRGNVTIFRLSSVYGVNGGKIRENSFVNFIVRDAVKEGKIKIFGDEVVKSFISVKDVCLLIQEAISDEICGLYNISSETLCLGSVASMVVAQYPCNVEYRRPLEDDRQYRINDTAMLSSFKSAPRHGIGSEIKYLIEYFKKH